VRLIDLLCCRAIHSQKIYCTENDVTEPEETRATKHYMHYFLIQHLYPLFVKYLSEHPNYVEAVFAGRTHGSTITYNVSVDDINTPSHWIAFPDNFCVLYNSTPTCYIITKAST